MESESEKGSHHSNSTKLKCDYSAIVILYIIHEYKGDLGWVYIKIKHAK